MYLSGAEICDLYARSQAVYVAFYRISKIALRGVHIKHVEIRSMRAIMQSVFCLNSLLPSPHLL